MADVWTPQMGPGTYDFEAGRFIPAAPADSAGATPAPLDDDFGFGLDADEIAEVAAVMSGLGQADEQPAEQAPAEPVDEPVDEQPAEPVDEAPAEPKAAPDVAEVRAAAEEIAMLDALHKHIGDELKRVKEENEPLFAAAVNLGGGRTIDLKLPDGTKVGTFNVTEPGLQIAWDDKATLKHVQQTSKHNLYEVINPSAINHEDVAAFIKLTHPELVKEQVRPAYLTLLAEGLDEDGCVVAEGGELIKLAKWVPVPSDGKGKCGWTRQTKDKPSGREKLVMAWREGKLAGRISIDPPAAQAE